MGTETPKPRPNSRKKPMPSPRSGPRPVGRRLLLPPTSHLLNLTLPCIFRGSQFRDVLGPGCSKLVCWQFKFRGCLLLGRLFETYLLGICECRELLAWPEHPGSSAACRPLGLPKRGTHFFRRRLAPLLEGCPPKRARGVQGA